VRVCVDDFIFSARGIAIGIAVVEDVMTPINDSIGQVLRALGDALVGDPVDRDLQAVFEQEVRRALGIRSVRLREIPARYHARLVTPTRTTESMLLGVPSSDPRVQAILEATFDAGSPPSEADLDLLAAATQLAGLVLEASRTRVAAMMRNVDGAAPLIGSSGIMHALRGRVERVALTDFTVLIEGESGTGKELVARQLHAVSRRRTGPFVAVNCAALVETLLEAELFGIEERTATGVRGRRGKFEHADGGTLFLDEISDLSLSAQAKLLRAIQDLAVERVGGNGSRRVNTRIVAATNRPLSDMVSRGLFRNDLYYRLGGVEIHVPPLRARREDISELAIYVLARHRHTRDLSLSDAVVDALRLYAWPGNVRELERFIERAVALTESNQIELDDLTPHLRGDYVEILGPSFAAGESLRAWGSRYARLVFERCGRNKRRACRQLDISYHTLEAYLHYSRGDGYEGKQLPAGAPAATAPDAVHEAQE
jgi:DNA-binding NtrC family response regulator